MFCRLYHVDILFLLEVLYKLAVLNFQASKMHQTKKKSKFCLAINR